MIRLLTIATIITTCIGCQQETANSTQTGEQEIAADTERGNDVESNATTRSMIGKWGIDGEAGLIVTETSGRIVFSTAENDTWRMEISNAKIVGEAVHFTQKNYLHNGEDHPFNAVACNSIAKMVDDDTLELRITTKDTPEYAADMLKRIE